MDWNFTGTSGKLYLYVLSLSLFHCRNDVISGASSIRKPLKSLVIDLLDTAALVQYDVIDQVGQCIGVFHFLATIV